MNTNGSIPIAKPVQEAICQKTPLIDAGCLRKNWTDGETTCLEYTRARNNVTRLMQKDKREFEKGICLKSKSNPKSLGWYVQHKLKTKTGVAALMEDNKDPESARFEDQGKANILQKQFSSVFTHEPDTDIPKLDKKTDASIYTLFVTNEMVREEILNLNVNKSCGLDNVHPRLLI